MKANLWALSCILQHESSWVKGNLKGLGSGKDGEKMEDRDTGSILVDYQTKETRDKSTTTYTTSGERDISGKIRDQESYVWRGMKYVTRVRGKAVKG